MTSTGPDGDLRVLQVTPLMHPETGGVQIHVLEVSRRLAQYGVDTSVLTSDRSGQLPSREVIDGVSIERVRAYPRSRDWVFAPALTRRILKSHVDLIHVQSYHTFVAPVAMMAALRARIPFVLTFHGGGHSSTLRNSVRSPQLSVLRPLLSRANKLVSIAEFEIDRYAGILRLPHSRFVSIPNGADLPTITGPAPDAGGEIIVSPGRLERYKGHQHLIAALPYVREEIPDASLWIAGSGPYEHALREQARALGVGDHVEISYVADRETMARRLGGASVGALFSEFETHPLAALEALSVGLPMVVANNSGLAELVQRGWALPVELTDSPREHAEALIKQLRSPRRVENLVLPTWDDCARSLAELYRSVVDEVRSPAG